MGEDITIRFMESISGFGKKITDKKHRPINLGDTMNEVSRKSSFCSVPEMPFLDEDLIRVQAEKLHKSSAMGYRKRRKNGK